MKITDILRVKGDHVVTIAPDRSVLDAVRVLVEHDIGSVVVAPEGRPAGILTERDVLRLVAAGENLEERSVASAMSRALLVGRPDQDLRDVMDVMTTNRVRHLPVVDEEGMRGIVSIGDVVNACRSQAEEEAAHLRDYIRGG